MNNKILSLSLILLSLVAIVYAQKTLLTDVKVLTLEKGKYTTGRRSSPIPQLQCSGAACYSDYEPNVIQCYNQGSDSYGNVQWRCDAQLDQDVQFGKTIVSCEGYDYPDDPYILQGSCGLEYELEYTRQGKQKKNSGSSHYSSGDYYAYKHNSSTDIGTWIGIILICVILYAIWNQLQANQNRERYGGNYRPGGTDDFGPGGNDHNRNDYPNSKYSNNNMGNTYAPPPTYGYAPGNGYGYGGYRPGFWTGFGGGGLLGYLLGSRRGYGTGYGTGYGGYRSYGGGSFGGGSSSGSSGSRSSSGFGGTRRR